MANEALVRSAAVELPEGASIRGSLVDDACVRIEGRLLSTGYFSSVHVLAIESMSEPGSINVIIELEDGFLLRFDGGPIYGAFGVLNLGGDGQDLGFRVGLNVQELNYLAHLPALGSARFTLLGGRIDTPLLSYSGDALDYKKVGGSLALEKDLGWGWQLGTSLGAFSTFNSEWQQVSSWLEPSLGVQWEWLDRRGFWSAFSPKEGLDLSINAKGVISSFEPEQTFFIPRAEFKGYLALVPGDSTLALRLLGASHVLVRSIDPIHGLQAAGADMVRIAVSKDTLGTSLAMASVELRTRFISGPFMDFSRLGLEGFLFADGALVYKEDRQDTGPLSAAGLGIRLFFGPPIHVPATLSLSFDKEGQPCLFFHTNHSF